MRSARRSVTTLVSRRSEDAGGSEEEIGVLSDCELHASFPAQPGALRPDNRFRGPRGCLFRNSVVGVNGGKRKSFCPINHCDTPQNYASRHFSAVSSFRLKPPYADATAYHRNCHGDGHDHGVASAIRSVNFYKWLSRHFVSEINMGRRVTEMDIYLMTA
ncbi:hypothetical protein CEXT_777821 [Caerostris extrusa]|uniref:Uncharacterized protein n=1 Tax=Caerostris extrusa TaxID=172846 RepID=A0AAV4WYR8_CAEEX|nr:hypothetical protein CEXT_777821 [Caerostris extrusa]